MDGVDDLGVVDSTQVRGGDAEVGVTELALDHDERDAFSRHLNSMGVPELMWSEPAPDPGRGSGVVQLGSNAGGAAPSPSCGSVQDAEERSDRKGLAQLDPRLKLLPRPPIHPDLSPFAAFALPYEDCSADGSRSVSASASASLIRRPARHSTMISALSLTPSARIRRVAQTLVVRRATLVEAGERGR